MANPPANSAQLKKLEIESFTDADCTSATGKKFAALVNPATISRRLSMDIDTDVKAPGNVDSQAQFRAINPQTLSFELILDGTGVIDGTGDNEGKSVQELIDAFIEVAVNYDGEQHEPNYTKILWGGLIFKGRLSSCDISYTLFMPGGDPLRAKLNLSFVSTKTFETQDKLKGNRSPDLSHSLVVKEGDTLPLMCNQIYKDSSLYIQVARINCLVNFRNLVPGTTILFPPIK